MDSQNTPILRRRCSEMNIKRSCSGSKIDLDDLVFKSPSLDMTPKRKRKRHRTDDDCLSLQSVDISYDEPKKRRRSSLARMGSLTNLLSPIRPVKKVGQALQKSFSLKNLMSPSAGSKQSHTPYRKPPPTPPRRRASTLWHETIKVDDKQKFSHSQIERQEAIFELYKCEEDLIEDLHMVKTTYHDSMSKLRLMTDDELAQIFGSIDTLVPLHQELVEGLRDRRQPDGTTDSIGQVLLDWVPRLKEYVPYCSNQVYAKALLDMKKEDPAVEDFLQRCQESPFSRRLDLWSFLDVPRSRLVKYPLLFRNIQKLTPAGHEDIDLLEQSVQVVEEIITEVDKKTGEAKCQHTKDKLEYLDDKQKHELIDESQVILCDGTLKNNRGTKLHVFLFEKILVLTRPATRGHLLKYQVYRQPIPITDLVLDVLEEGQSKSGSFRSAFSQNQTGKNFFKVSSLDGSKGQSHTLQANDEHDKRQWVNCIQEVLPKQDPEPTEEREPGDGQAADTAEEKTEDRKQDEEKKYKQPEETAV